MKMEKLVDGKEIESQNRKKHIVSQKQSQKPLRRKLEEFKLNFKKKSEYN